MPIELSIPLIQFLYPSQHVATNCKFSPMFFFSAFYAHFSLALFFLANLTNFSLPLFHGEFEFMKKEKKII